MTLPAPPASASTPPPGAEEMPPLIREWHTMTSDEQATEWAALVAWVAWLYDQYELSREERLPLCWPQHPGLVEELRSLKVWREHVYDTPDNGAAHSARSWHGELRQTIAAAISFWAPGCRVGHKPTGQLADADPGLRQRWLETGPPQPGTAPAPAPKAADEGVVAGLQMSLADMDAALADGRAVPHSDGLPQFVKHDGAWWIRQFDPGLWLRATDPVQHARLDESSVKMRLADAAVGRHRAKEETDGAPTSGAEQKKGNA